MPSAPEFKAPSGGGPKQWALIALAVIAVLALGWYVYRQLTGVVGVAVKQAPPTVVNMLPPPPPPPPPPQEKPPEPAEKPADTPEPQPQPQPDKAAPAEMKMDATAQAGTDSYGVQSGQGGGAGAPGSGGICLTPPCGGGGGGGGGVDRFWGRNVADALERHIQQSGRVNVDSFVSEYEIWVSASGAVTQARLVQSSGNGELDRTVLALLQTASGLKVPPPSIRMPQRIKVGRKRLS